MITFTNIHWRNLNDRNIFGNGELKSLGLNGMEQGIIEIECACNIFKAPYYKLHFGGGIEHFTLITKHPYEIGKFIEIAIFDGCVAVVPANDVQEPWFEYKCKTFVPTF